MAKEAASSQEEITLMTVKHWNTGPAAARFRIQAASVKLKKNKSKAASIKLGGPAQPQAPDCDNLTLDSGRLMGYSGIMKTFTVIGRVWTRGHGYLATRCQMDFEAKNKTRAINMARELRNVGKNFVSCNNFVAFDADCPEDNPLAMTPAEREHERDYWAQEARISDDPEIMPH